jgi:hypothetical protein
VCDPVLARPKEVLVEGCKPSGIACGKLIDSAPWPGKKHPSDRRGKNVISRIALTDGIHDSLTRMFEPEKKFQRHIADFLIREHGFAVLTQDEITDTDFYFAEDHLYAFLKATQPKLSNGWKPTTAATPATRFSRRCARRSAAARCGRSSAPA